jgi:hypothetical protein
MLMVSTGRCLTTLSSPFNPAGYKPVQWGTKKIPMGISGQLVDVDAVNASIIEQGKSMGS